MLKKTLFCMGIQVVYDVLCSDIHNHNTYQAIEAMIKEHQSHCLFLYRYVLENECRAY